MILHYKGEGEDKGETTYFKNALLIDILSCVLNIINSVSGSTEL